jgi:hypothetical protein
MQPRRLLTEPLLHFFLIGALLFYLYGWLNNDETGDLGEIVVSAAVQEQLAATFQRTWQRAPTAQEMTSLVDGWVREEVLYRQGVAMGFDQGDPVIRRRVAQKVSFVADGLAPETPTDEELNAWLETRTDAYQVPPRYSFEQVYINPGQHAGDLEAYLASTLAALQGAAGAGSGGLGDSIMLPGEVAAATPRDIERVFGLEFAAAVAAQSPGAWQGPVISGFGLHFVRVNDVLPGRRPGLDEVRAEVERDYLDERAGEISDAFYEALRERYTVRVEPAISGS